MSLPQADTAHLSERGINYTVASEGNMLCVVMHEFALPCGYDKPSSDLLLRLSPGYPDVPPDMWWFDPPAKLADGRAIQATESVENYLGRSWQRWSRHFNGGQWRPGTDGLESFLALIRKELERCVRQPVR